MKKIFLLTHSLGITGQIDYYREYLFRRHHQARVYYLTHPLDDYQGRESCFWDGRRRIRSIERRGGTISNLLRDIYISLLIMRKVEIDEFVGADNLCLLIGLIAQKIFGKKYGRIVFYASDFSRNHFGGRLMNFFYLKLESFVLKRADLVISNTFRAQRERKKLGLDHRGLVIPNGAFLRKKVFHKKNISKGRFVFVGNVTREHGLLEMVSFLGDQIKLLVVIGQGERIDELMKICQKKSIQLKFYLKKDYEFVINFLQEFEGYGLAPYQIDAESTFFRAPLKASEYISCGVPVILPKIIEIASDISRENFGIAYKDMTDLKPQLMGFNDKDFFRRAKKFYAQFNWDILYQRMEFRD